ncbi:peptide chain release factor N(5)-glutamine methyltransferase [Thermopirellula anaerolimosa]
MPETEVWTIGRLLAWTTEYLGRHGSESPRLDAEVLLAAAKGCRRIDLYAAFEEIASDEVRAKFRSMVRERADGTPVAYLVGRREFFSLSFHVTPAVLIPRPETEDLVVRMLDLAKEFTSESPVRVCDVGTGSGVLAVCAAKHLPQAEITAVDVSKEALRVAEENAERLGLAERIRFLQSDLLDALPPQESFHLICSNPPYVSEEEFARLPRDVREHEPYQALVAGPRGTEIIARLVPQAAERLVPGGWLLIEISPMIREAVEAILAAEPRLEPGPILKDSARRWRIAQARRT